MVKNRLVFLMTGEQIVAKLHSITKVTMEEGGLVVHFDNKPEAFTIAEFSDGTFTKAILRIVEGFLSNGE